MLGLCRAVLCPVVVRAANGQTRKWRPQEWTTVKSDEKEKSQWLCIIGLFLIGESKEAYGMGKTKVKMIQKSGGKSMERSSRKSI